MKHFANYIILIITIFMVVFSYGQKAKTPTQASAKELTITLKNDSEHDVQVFAGPKKKVFEGKSRTLGGRSVNTIYVKEGDVVCIMKGPKAVAACADAKKGISKMEINPSGLTFAK